MDTPMETIADDLIYCRFCRQNLPLASFLKDGQRKKMCAGCRAKRGGPRGSRKKADKAQTQAEAQDKAKSGDTGKPEPAVIMLDICQAEQVLSALLGGLVTFDGDQVMFDSEALARHFPNSADLLPLLIKGAE